MTKGIDKKLDTCWREIVKNRAGMKCEKCGKDKNLNAHHIFGRRNKAVRWEISNGCCLCAKHHTFSSTFSAHQAPTAFSEWIIGVRGREWHDALMAMANRIKKWTKSDKQELLEEFKRCLE